MILGSPAQTAGVEQGDQVLQIDDMQVDGQSPFQAASAISGGDGEPDSVPAPLVHLQVPNLRFAPPPSLTIQAADVAITFLYKQSGLGGISVVYCLGMSHMYGHHALQHLHGRRSMPDKQ